MIKTRLNICTANLECQKIVNIYLKRISDDERKTKIKAALLTPLIMPMVFVLCDSSKPVNHYSDYNGMIKVRL